MRDEAGAVMLLNPKPKTETYSIVAIGQMNPGIHHAAWYHHVGLIDDTEFEEATAGTKTDAQTETLLSVPTVKVGAFVATCFNNRWDIRTTYRNQVGRIRSVAENLFDRLLPHTPIGAVGLNFEFGFESTEKPAGKLVADSLMRTSLGFGLSDPNSGEIKISEKRSDCTLNIIVRPSDDGKMLGVVVNVHYLFPPDKTEVQWSFKDKVGEGLEAKQKEAEEISARLASQLLGG